jgi:hypothetical protein
MPSTDYADGDEHRAALTHLDEAGRRLEEARAKNAHDLLNAEQAFAVAMTAYRAARERFAEPTSRELEGAPVARVWLGQADVVLRAPADPR